MEEAEATYQIRTHLLYELRWMIYAACQFRPGCHHHVALIDSATVHARNLFEFAADQGNKYFTLHALGGTPKKMSDWDGWANNRVTHMLQREHARLSWPDGLDNDRPDRLMVMADAVLHRLEEGGTTIPGGPVRDAYDGVVRAARAYWREPTEAMHQELQALYDGSRDDRPY